MLELVDELVAGTATSGGGGSAPAVIEELNVTPSTSAQTITAPSGTDGYSPVNVSAVTSSIDANIQATNIRDGVSILGVEGTLVEGGDVITATNNTSDAVASGDKVWINKSYVPTSGQTKSYNKTSGGSLYSLVTMSPDFNKIYVNKSISNSTGFDFSTLTEDGGTYDYIGYSSLTALQDGSIIGYTSSYGSPVNIGNNGVSAVSSGLVTFNNGCYYQSYSFYTKKGVLIYQGAYQKEALSCFSWSNNGNEYAIASLGSSYSGTIKFYSITNDGETVTQIGSGPDMRGVYMNCAGISKDGKIIVFDQQGMQARSGNGSLKILQVDYTNNSIADVSSSVLPSSVTSLMASSHKSAFNPNTGILWIIDKNATQLNQLVVCRYNESTGVFDDITSTVSLPSGVALYVNSGVCISDDLKKIAFASNYVTSVSPLYANVFATKISDVWYIEDFSNVTTDSYSGVSKENIASGSTGTVETILPE